MTSWLGSVLLSPISAGKQPNLFVDVHVTTNPILVDFKAGDTIEIRCKVKAYLTINDYLYVSFVVSSRV